MDTVYTYYIVGGLLVLAGTAISVLTFRYVERRKLPPVRPINFWDELEPMDLKGFPWKVDPTTPITEDEWLPASHPDRDGPSSELLTTLDIETGEPIRFRRPVRRGIAYEHMRQQALEQKLSSEMTPEQLDRADWQAGYDAMVMNLRFLVGDSLEVQHTGPSRGAADNRLSIGETFGIFGCEVPIEAVALLQFNPRNLNREEMKEQLIDLAATMGRKAKK